MPVLFCQIFTGYQFYFGDKPERILVKVDEKSYTDNHKIYPIHQHVLVFPYWGVQNEHIAEHGLQVQ